MSVRIPHIEMADELDKLVYSKRTWLSTFSTGRDKRPDHEIDTRSRQRAVLEQAADDYRRAAYRDQQDQSALEF